MKTWQLIKKPKAKITSSIKEKVSFLADELINSKLKKKYIPKQKGRPKINYIVDIYGKWYRQYYYFCSKYKCPSSNSISPYFETKFARIEYLSNNNFNLSYMRHTGSWWKVAENLTLNQCFNRIESEGIFIP